jgi:hypothetical protein
MYPIQLSVILLPCLSFFLVNAASSVASNQTDSSRHPDKQFESARFSFYDVGLGACGAMNKASDFIVAMNQPQFTSGDWCFKTISVHYQGKTAQAKVMDMCPGCPFGGLDFSRGLFDYFASEGAGIIYGSWDDGQEKHREASSSLQKQEPPIPSSTPKRKPNHIEESHKSSIDVFPLTKISSLGSVNVADNHLVTEGAGNALEQLYSIFIAFGGLQSDAMKVSASISA